MANLGNLWFTLGLDDSSFRRKWEGALRRYAAQGKINLDVVISPKTIESLKKLSSLGGTKKQWNAVAAAAKAAGAASLAMAKAEKTAAIQATKHEQELARLATLQARAHNESQLGGQKLANTLLQQQLIQQRIATEAERTKKVRDSEVRSVAAYTSQWSQNIRNIASNLTSIYAIKNFVKELAEVTGQFELQRRTLQAMVGEFEGSQLYEQMKELAVRSPFQFKDLAGYVKQLSAFSIESSKLYDTTKRLADVSAGLGVDMSRIILAYGQIKSAQVLKGTELRQLTEAGVPILERLAQKFSEIQGRAVSVGEVFDMISKKLVPFSMVEEVFRDLTSEGGKFFNMQEIQADTLAGKISNLRDAYQIMLSNIGEAQGERIKGTIDLIFQLMKNYQALGVIISGVFGKIVTTSLLSKGFNIKDRLASIKAEVGEVNNLSSAYGNLSKATRRFLKANAVGIFVSITAAIVAAVNAAKSFERAISRIINEEMESLQSELSQLDSIIAKLQDSADGTQARRDAIKQLNANYGQYLNNMLTEADTAERIGEAYREINHELENQKKYEIIERLRGKVDERFTGEIDDLYSSLYDYLSGVVGKRGAAELQRMITQTLTSEQLYTAPSDEELQRNLQKIAQEYRRRLAAIGRGEATTLSGGYGSASIQQISEVDILQGHLSQIINIYREYYQTLEETIQRGTITAFGYDETSHLPKSLRPRNQKNILTNPLHGPKKNHRNTLNIVTLLPHTFSFSKNSEYSVPVVTTILLSAL